jgi:hypothetical protein
MSFASAYASAYDVTSAAPEPAPTVTWPYTWACDPPADQALADAVLAAAQSILWAATGRRYAVVTLTDVPVPVRRFSWCGCMVGPALIDGDWWNVPLCEEGCEHDACCWLFLPCSPVRAVTAVSISGTALDPADWRAEGDRIYLTDGCWPRVEECDPSPVTATWTCGLDPPPGADLAMGELACELAKGWTTGSCRLPSRVTNITRQGVSMDLGGDLAVLLDHGLLGLPICDAFIRATNPAGLSMASAVLSPDFPGTRPYHPVP